MQEKTKNKSYSHLLFVAALVLAMLGFQTKSQAQLSGTYTIGGTTPDYATFSAAAAALNGVGVNGPVVFDVRTGTYTENITLTDIGGVSATNTVTFRSETGVATDVILQSSSTDVIVLHNADYFIFENLTVSYTGTSTFSAFELQDDADNVTISGCILSSNSTSISTTASNSLIYVSETSTSLLVDYLTIQNCTFSGAGYGVYFASGSAKSEGIEVLGNTFIDCYYRAAYLDDCAAPLVQSNFITNASNANSNYTAIEVAYSSGASEITGNEIVSSYIKYGIYVNNSDGSSGNEVLVANNMISMGGASPFSSVQGIRLLGSDYVNVYFNSIDISNTYNTSSSACLYLSGSSTDNSINLANNIFSVSAGGDRQVCIYLASTSYVSDIDVWDYNDYNATGSSHAAYIGGNRTTLANLQSYTGKDANSLDIDPLFVSSTDLHTTETALKAGTTIAVISTDIDGDIRQIPPYIGADEIAAPTVANDAAITGLSAPTLPPCPGSNTFEVDVTNYGTNTLTSVTINWTINGVGQTPINATGLSVATNASTTISLGSVSLTSNTSYDFVFTASSPNGASDGNATNDTYTLSSVYTSLSGAYTIGGTSPDFATFNDAADALHAYGVCGPVVMNVRQGTYTEQVEINEIVGASAINTVTFQPDAANTNPAILTYSGQTSSENFVLGLNGAKYLRVQGLTLQTNTSGTYRNVIQFFGETDDIVINGNNFISSSSIGTSYSRAIIFGSSFSGTNNNNTQITNNSFTYGSFAIYWASVSSFIETGNVIEGNTITGSYEGGIYANYQSSFIIRDNIIKDFNGSTWSVIGIELENSDGQSIIENNQIEIVKTSGSHYGIRLSSVDATSGSRSRVANNFVTVENTGVSSTYAFYASSCDYLDYVFNNSYTYSGSSSYYSLYITSGSNVRLFNNVNSANGAGGSIYASSFALTNSDYNNFYHNTADDFGSYSGSRATFADWQSASSMDANSLTIDPQYTATSSPYDLHISASGLASAGTAFASITEDIDGDTRDNPPTIGADEYVPAAGDDAGVTAMVLPIIPPCPGSNAFEVTVTNLGTNTLASFTIDWSINGVPQTPVNVTGLSLATSASTNISLGNATLSSNTAYNFTFSTSNPNGNADVDATNDTLKNVGVFTSLNGTYTIGGATPDFANFTQAASALNTYGVCGPVVFNVREGTYTEQVEINAVAGASAVNTITFQADAANSSAAILTYSSQSSSATNYVLGLVGASYIRVYNLNIQTSNTSTYATVISLAGNTDDIILSYNSISAATSSSSSVYKAVISDYGSTSATSHRTQITDNIITGGSSGIYLNGTFSTDSEDNLIQSNYINNMSSSGIYAYYQDGIKITGNLITDFAYPANSVRAIELYQSNGPVEVEGNAIEVTGTGGSKYGIYLSSVDGTVFSNIKLANNMVYLTNTSSSSSFGVYTSSSDYVRVYFNNIYTSSNSVNSYSVYVPSGSNVSVHNNNVQTDGLGNTIYGSSSTLAFSDYNNFYHTSSGNFGSYSGTRATFADWQSGSGEDANSLTIDPQYTSITSPSDLHVNNAALAGTGVYTSSVMNDFDGEVRSDPPTIGADEIVPATGEDAAVTALVNPALPPCPGSNAFVVEVTNLGTNMLTSFTVNWSINGVPQTPVSVTGLSLATNATTNVSLGSSTLLGNTSYDFNFSTNTPNGVADVNASNDSLEILGVYASLNGSYTIGGTSPDFANFTDAVYALNTYGVCGPVVMNVRQGTYTEQIAFNTITGASATNTITFQPDAANTLDAILEYNSQLFATNYVIEFSEASFIRFNDLTIRTTNTGSYRTVIHFANNNTDIQFEGNNIEAPTAPGSSIYYAVVFMDNTSGTYDNDIVFDGNTITNGSYGLYFEGYIGDYETGNEITNNVVTGFYFTGIYAEYQDGILIQGNEVRGSGPYLIAADLSYFIGYVNISNNIFEAAGSGSGGINIGLQMLDCDGPSGNPSLVSNNFIIATAPANTVEGIRFGSSTIHYDFVANNIYVSGTNASSTSGVYFNGADEIGFYSNNVFCDGPGNCIEYLTTSNQLYSNYNNLAVAGGGIVGYYGGDRTTLADWQSAASIDANSVSIDPQYTTLSSPFDLHISENSLPGAGDAYAGITVDIDGDTRDTPPTIGADEITPTGCVTPIANNIISGGGSFCEIAPAGSITGTVPTGGDASYTYRWQISANGVTYGNLSTGQNQSHSAVTGNVWFRRIVTSGDCEDTSNVITFEITPAITNNTISGTGTFCDEIPAGTITGANPAGGSGSYTYQWQESTDGTTYGNVSSGGGSADYSHGVINNSIWYQRIVTSGQCADTSSAAVLTIKTGFIWTGAISTNWHVPANWDCGDVPDATKDVVIPSIAVNQPEILTDSIGECRTIQIEGGSQLIIRSAARLNVEN